MIVADDRVAKFVSEEVGAALVPPFTAMGIERDGEITAGVVFNCFEGADVHFTAAGKGWTKEFMRAVGDYVFRQLGCLRMTATTEQESVVALACKLGGQIEGRMRNHFGVGRDGVIIGVLAEEYRFS